MLKQCPICQKEYKTKPSEADRRIYCSHQCRSVARRAKADIANTTACVQCGASFVIENYLQKYCSPACYRAARRTGAEQPCRDCGAPVYLSATQLAKRTRQPYCNACYQRHHEAVLAGTRLRVQTCEKCEQIFEGPHLRRFCPTCSPIQWDGKSPNAICVVCGKPYAHPDPEHCKTCSPECSRKNSSAQHRGANSHFWRGGLSTPEELARKGITYKDWRLAVFTRDNRTCQLCGAQPSRPEAHHIYPFKAYPHRRTDVTNGITLCKPCHSRIARREQEYIAQFEAIVRSKTP